MDSPFKTIGLIGKPNHPGAAATLQPESTAASWGTDVPSAQLIITKLI